MQTGNSICQVCERKAPSVFCQCSTPEVLLCEDCTGKHILQNPGKVHANAPIAELSYYKIPGYYERLETRKEALPIVKEQLLKGVAEVDRALGEYTVAVERVLSEFTTRVEQEMRQWKSVLLR